MTYMNKLMTTAAAASLIAGAAAAQDMISTDGAMISGETITFANVEAAQDGYLVIHAVNDGEVVVPASIGHTAVMAGVNEAVVISTDYPLVVGEDYVAMLHVETNGNTTYDFAEGMTDVDTPAMMDDAPVTKMFAAAAMMEDTDIDMDAPMMDMGDSMAMIGSSDITIANVNLPDGGYVTLHEVVDGAPVVPQSIGHVAVEPGLNESVVLTSDVVLEADKEYMLMLHDETNANGTYDFGVDSTDVDTPVMINGEMLTTVFSPMAG